MNSTHLCPRGESQFFKGAVLEDNRDQWDRERGQKGEQGEYNQSIVHTIKNKGAGRVVMPVTPLLRKPRQEVHSKSRPVWVTHRTPGHPGLCTKTAQNSSDRKINLCFL